MSRYIDADVVMEVLERSAKDPRNETAMTSWANAFQELINLLDDTLMPMATADVRENAKGRWNPISTTSDARQCSACGFVFGDVKMIRMSPTTSVIQHAYDFAFCPMCGAEMKGET